MRVAVILALVLPHAIFGLKMMTPAEEPKPVADSQTTVQKYMSSMKANDVAGMLSTMSDNAKVTIHRPFKKHANTVMTGKAALEYYFTANQVHLGKEGNYREDGETLHSSKVKLSEPRKVVTHAKVKVPKVGWIVIQSVFLLSNDNIIQSIDHHPKIVIPVIPPH